MSRTSFIVSGSGTSDEESCADEVSLDKTLTHMLIFLHVVVVRETVSSEQKQVNFTCSEMLLVAQKGYPPKHISSGFL